MSKFIKIPLSEACNHKLIYAQKQAENVGIGLDGMYIQGSDFKFATNDIIDETEFAFSLGNNDNIECAGQTLKINTCADKLHIIGFALWGDTHSVFKIVHENGIEDYVTAPFINWAHSYSFNWFDMSSVGGDIVSHGVIATGKQPCPVYLHHIAVELPKGETIKEIILPDNFCLHIMAITLEKSNNSKE